ncbi:hypothetical protein LTR47_003712 [Exophiala xenobiotica]|nr:hypothetical protein LTR47_003712 [Exophiala xenobiotica]KAK5245119.1 hypothetical protein LTS06_009405 [Exophiala xenobiotica]KAK5321316.1 hypothetical protein LTR93_006559 [Exophiala xenobiotica]KAK5347897.1 hypothetical protein LTR61_008526 [Exophiala xenobiotica]KAK5369636.1 hypothetical protein LTR11_006968 [Exophiala xenobiotica]
MLASGIPGGGGLILVLCALGLLVGQLVYNKYAYGISRIPGPTLAAYTNLWRFFVVWGRRPERTHIKLHQRYGPVVRLGPNCVSVSDPAAIKSIYGLASGYVKSDFYLVQQQAVSRDGHLLQGMFNTTDEAYHSKLRRAVNNAFAMSTLVQFEPLVDSTTTEFFKQLTRRYADKPDQICDLGEWLQFYAFDVIGELTFSQRLGFLDRGVDVENIISDLEKALGYFAVVRSIPPIAIYAPEVQVVREGPLTLAITSQIGQIPILDKLLLKNPLRMYLSRWGVINATSPVAVFAKSRMASRLHGSEKKSDNARRRDFLSRFLEASEKDPAFMTPERVLSLTSANVFAGSDTTAITLRAIFYYLLKNPSKLETLQRDIARAEKERLFTREDKLVRWSEANAIPYLGAVIKESLRIHPAAGLPLERVVPPGGATISGHYVPAGTIVGCSAWTIHRDTKIFGNDVDAFRPERWLEDPAKAAEMNQFLFSFGAGARTCAGKNISYLELYKLVPAMLRTFDLQLVYPEREWHLDNRWFVKQSEFYVRLTTKGPGK